jgi:hypothetical protein
MCLDAAYKVQKKALEFPVAFVKASDTFENQYNGTTSIAFCLHNREGVGLPGADYLAVLGSSKL